MKKSIATKWIKALRSGKYKQGKRQLRTPENEYCCLGVLCDISKKGKWTDKSYYKTTIGASWSDLPGTVMEWAEMNTSLGHIPPKFETLSALNDAGKTFEEIAAVIEQYWKYL